LRTGDLIVAMNGQDVASVDDMHRVLAEWPIGRPLGVIIVRGKDRLEFPVTPAEAR
jgi:S1-C subfamily serine protease